MAVFTRYLSVRGKGIILEQILEDRLSKMSFVGFHMVRDDLLRLCHSQSQSAASQPKKAHSLAKRSICSKSTYKTERLNTEKAEEHPIWGQGTNNAITLNFHF